MHKEKFIRKSILVISIILVFVFVSLLTKDTFDRNTTQKPDDISLLELDTSDLNQKTLEGIKESESKTENSEDGSNNNFDKADSLNATSDQTFTKLEVNNAQTENIGSGSVRTLGYKIESDGSYLIQIPDISISAYVVRWNEGDLYLGESVDHLTKIYPEIDEGETFKGLVSNLIYPTSKTAYIRTKGVNELNIDIFSTSTEPIQIAKTSEIQNADSGAKYSSLNIISRDVWGASPASWDPNSSLDIDDPARYTWTPGYFRVSKFVIHHTASSNTPEDPDQAVRNIYLYHAYSRGWGDIGYNYLIDAWGNIYEGKGGGDEVYGYHAYTEANTMSIGIALIGDFTSTGPTYAAKQALIKLLAEKATFYNLNLVMSSGSLTDWLSTNVTVYGHKDSYFWCHSGHVLSYLCTDRDKWVVNNTACPGASFESLLSSEIVPAATNYKNYNFYDLKKTVAEVNNLIDKNLEEVNWLIVEYDLPESTPASQIETLIPVFSGIKDYEIHKNKVILHLGDWDEGIPDYGFDGFYGSNTFFPASEGNNDRVRTLMKIFMMDPDVVQVAPYNKYHVSPIE